MKNKKVRSIIAVALLVAIVSALLGGCGKSGGDSNGNTPAGPTASLSADGIVYTTEEKYVAEYAELPEEIGQIINLCVYNDQLYFGAYVFNTGLSQDSEAQDSASDEYMVKLYKMNFDGTGLTELSGYTAPDAPEGSQYAMYVSAMNVDDNGNIWVVESNNASTSSELALYLRKLDITGAELQTSDISGLAENKAFVYITGIQFDKAGNIYMSDMTSGVYVYDGQGKPLYELETPNQPAYISSLFGLNDGGIAALVSGGTGMSIKMINTDAKGWGSEIPLTIAYGAYSGSGEYDFYYNDGSNLFGYSIEKSESTKLLQWIDCYVSGENLNSLVVLPDGAIYGSSYSMDGETVKAELAMISMQTVSEAQNKTVLKLALFGIDPNIRAAVAEFNKENELYKIEVTDYLEFGTTEDITAGLTKLNTEIISGNIPDLICTMGVLSVDKYIAKGLLEDLNPYLDNDTGLGGREAFLPEVLGALEKDGALYQIAPGFMIYTVLGKTDVVGAKSGWTFEEMLALLDQYPDNIQIMPNISADSALSLLNLSMSDYVNWQTGECYFNNAEFIKILEFANRFPKKAPDTADAESNYTLIKEGRALLDIAMLSSFLDYQMYKLFYGGDLTFIGYPCESGSGSTFYFTNCISISSKCKYKETAWEFVRSLLTEEYQTGGNLWQFPTNKAAFAKYTEEAMKKETAVDENGEVTEVAKGSGFIDGQIIEIYAATQEDVDQVMELIGSIDKTMGMDMEISNIVSEEAQAYFNGQKSAEEVAGLIQQRVSTYVNEQR